HGVVRLARHIEHAVEELLREAIATRRDDGGEVRHRPAARQETPSALRVADDPPQPVDDGGLHLGEGRRGVPDSHEAVRRERQIIAERGGVEPAAGAVRQVAGAARVAGLGRRRGLPPLPPLESIARPPPLIPCPSYSAKMPGVGRKSWSRTGSNLSAFRSRTVPSLITTSTARVSPMRSAGLPATTRMSARRPG